MNRLPASQRYKPKDRRWKRYEKQLPGHHVQIDVKFIAPITAAPAAAARAAVPVAAPAARRKKYYQYTAIDDCTRLRVLRIYDRNNQKTAIPSPTTSSPGCRSRSRRSRRTTAPNFSRRSTGTSQDLGIRHRYIKPATPRLNGKVERSHRIDAEEFYRLLDGVVIDDTKLFNDKLAEWENFYNYHRPHGGLGGQTPYERLKQKTQTPVKRSTSVAHLENSGSQNPGDGLRRLHLGLVLCRPDVLDIRDLHREEYTISPPSRPMRSSPCVCSGTWVRAALLGGPALAEPSASVSKYSGETSLRTRLAGPSRACSAQTADSSSCHPSRPQTQIQIQLPGALRVGGRWVMSSTTGVFLVSGMLLHPPTWAASWGLPNRMQSRPIYRTHI